MHRAGNAAGVPPLPPPRTAAAVYDERAQQFAGRWDGALLVVLQRDLTPLADVGCGTPGAH
jgi:hypothetical protein